MCVTSCGARARVTRGCALGPGRCPAAGVPQVDQRRSSAGLNVPPWRAGGEPGRAIVRFWWRVCLGQVAKAFVSSERWLAGRENALRLPLLIAAGLKTSYSTYLVKGYVFVITIDYH